jgi:hypothetical protein
MRRVNPRGNDVVAVKCCDVLAANAPGHLERIEWDVQHMESILRLGRG